MITIQEAWEIVKNNLPEPQVEIVDLVETPGKRLAKEILAREPSPRFTNSAMDGFAVRWEDVTGASESNPAVLQIVGESRAGIPYSAELQPGRAVRISTGGMLCRGADTIVPVEDTKLSGNSLRVLKAEKPKNHVRFEGEEFKAGDLLLPRNTSLNSPQIALLASQGVSRVPVYKTPDVAVIVTGTELVPYDVPAQPWQIRDSNGIMLRSAIRKSGAKLNFNAHVGDQYEATVSAVRQAIGQANIILFSGGVSVGPHDLVKKAAQECGFETLFWRVKQKPGKPLYFARNREKLFFGLPGNPVSAYMCYLYYVQPVLHYLQGEEYVHRTIQGAVAAPVENKTSRAQLFRVTLEYVPGRLPQVYPIAKQGSHMLTSLTAANGFIHLEINVLIKPGETIEVIPFE
jgi:molybdopterin molybdotransferase